MTQVTPNDPARKNEHDYVIKGLVNDEVRILAAFDNQAEAMGWMLTHRQRTASILEVAHPMTCDCDEAPHTREEE